MTIIISIISIIMTTTGGRELRRHEWTQFQSTVKISRNHSSPAQLVSVSNSLSLSLFCRCHRNYIIILSSDYIIVSSHHHYHRNHFSTCSSFLRFIFLMAFSFTIAHHHWSSLKTMQTMIMYDNHNVLYELENKHRSVQQHSWALSKVAALLSHSLSFGWLSSLLSLSYSLSLSFHLSSTATPPLSSSIHF